MSMACGLTLAVAAFGLGDVAAHACHASPHAGGYLGAAGALLALGCWICWRSWAAGA